MKNWMRLLALTLGLLLTFSGVAALAEETEEVLPLEGALEALPDETAAPEDAFMLEAPEAVAEDNAALTINVEELRQQASKLRADADAARAAGNTEEADRLEEQAQQLEKRAAAYESTDEPIATTASDPLAVALTAAKDTVTVYPKLQFKITVDGATAKSFKTSNKKIATVNKDGLVTAKKRGTAKITVKLTDGKKRVLTVKVGPNPELSTLFGKNYLSSLTNTLGIKKKQIHIHAGKDEDAYYYCKNGLTLWGLETNRYHKKNPYREKLYWIEIEAPCAYRLFGLEIGSGWENVQQRLEAAGYTVTYFEMRDAEWEPIDPANLDNLEGTSGGLTAEKAGSCLMQFYASFENGKVTHLELYTSVWDYD